MIILLIAAAVLCALPLVDMVRRSDFRQMAFRNVARRRTESALIILGSALGTAVICAALLVGDTFGHSVRDIARTRVGEVDITVMPESSADLAAAAAAISATELEGIDGILGIRRSEVAIANGLVEGTSQGAVEPVAQIGAADFDQAASFGTSPGEFGLGVSVPTPGLGEIVLHPDLAATLNAAVGDQVQVFAYGQEVSATVIALTSGVGLGGFVDAWVAPQILEQAQGFVLVSLDGGVFDSSANSDRFVDSIIEVLDTAAVQADVYGSKADLLADADDEEAEFTTIFTVVGGFSVIAGVVLLVNLFVMLSEERKPTLGVLRAVGWKRASLLRAFGVEGLLYAIPSAILGSLVGIGLGWILVIVTRELLLTATDGDFQILFAVPLSSLLFAFLAGVVLSMASIWVTSWRISRLNIISAIRDISEPPRKRRKVLVHAAGLLALVGGVALGFVGYSSDTATLAFVGVPLALVGLGMLARQVVRPSLLLGLLGAVIIAWGALFIPVMPESLTDSIEMEFFLLLGVVVVGGGVAVTTVVGPVLQRLLNLAGRPLVSQRLGMAYPVSRLFRTASSLAMYSLIIFSLAFMAVFSNGLKAETDKLVVNSSSNHDILLTSNEANPVASVALLAVDGVRATNSLLRGVVGFTIDEKSDDEDFWTISGIADGFADIGAPTLDARMAEYASDEQALQAVAASSDLLLVPEWFLRIDGEEREVGDVVFARVGDEQRPFTIAGVLAQSYVWNGAWTSEQAVESLDPRAEIFRTYIAVDDQANAEAVAASLETNFVRNGVQAETFEERVSGIVAVDLGIFALLRGYLLLGLVVGIAGLAVTLFRAVRERRRQIGMLRAMGMPSAGIRRWFMTEATFISVMGIVTGVALGILTGWLVTTQSEVITADPLPFSFPLVPALAICSIPFVASTIAAIVPAQRAANLLPSEALRLSD